MENERLNNVLTKIFVVALVILILTFSIGLPIYFRPFYYLHIDALSLPERTGHTKAEIKEAYNELLNYLTLPATEFGVGVFPYSAEGKDHFRDCKGLFSLNLILGLTSLATVICLWILDKKGRISLSRPNRCHISLAICKRMLTVVIIIAALASINFTKTFEIFHKAIFRNKTNWGFMETKDPIILALPERFFANCAIFIFLSVVIICITVIVVNNIINKKKNRRD